MQFVIHQAAALLSTVGDRIGLLAFMLKVPFIQPREVILAQLMKIFTLHLHRTCSLKANSYYKGFSQHHRLLL